MPSSGSRVPKSISLVFAASVRCDWREPIRPRRLIPTSRGVAVTTCGGFVQWPDLVPIQSQMGPSVSSPQPYRSKAPANERLPIFCGARAS